MNTLIPFLAFATLFAVAAFGYISAVKTEERRKSDAPKSTLAPDAPDTRPA